jgi:hypothetical protein
LKRVQERSEGIWTGASVDNISCDAGRIPSGHGWLAAMADRGSLIIFCTEREVEFLILHIEHPAKRKVYLS